MITAFSLSSKHFIMMLFSSKPIVAILVLLGIAGITTGNQESEDLFVPRRLRSSGQKVRGLQRPRNLKTGKAGKTGKGTPAPEPTPPTDPTPFPTKKPKSCKGSCAPSEMPSAIPSEYPTDHPTDSPSERPTNPPTPAPTPAPNSWMSTLPTRRPTPAPTDRPTPFPTVVPPPTITECPGGSVSVTVRITINEPDVLLQTGWFIQELPGGDFIDGVLEGSIIPQPPLYEVVVPGICRGQQYLFTISDINGDFNGSYEVSFGGTVLASGDCDFSSKEQTLFTIPPLM